jgi:hypothetical protein
VHWGNKSEALILTQLAFDAAPRVFGKKGCPLARASGVAGVVADVDELLVAME